MKAYLHAFFSAKGARLVLDYLKVLVWPLVVVSTLVIFSQELRTLLARMTSASISTSGISLAAGTGNPSLSLPVSPEKPPRPDVWFSIRTKPTAGLGCEDRARTALTRSGFPPTKAGDITYGYLGEKIVGVVWCGAPNNSVLITVAGGPVSDLQAKLTELENAFSTAGS